MKSIYYYDTEIGKIGIIEENGYIIEMSFGETKKMDYENKETKIIKEAHKQLNEYLHHKRQVFDLPINPVGTAFFKKVWKELQSIPYGEIRFYSEIAKNIGKPKASRAVGMACNRNPIPIFIPCHRVIGKDWSLTGYAGGLRIKEWLLNLEKNNPYAFEDM
jgi:methylated-DNA-[protein]-cysteine S-methyltransferase